MKTTSRTIELTVEKRERKFVRSETSRNHRSCGICGRSGRHEMFAHIANEPGDGSLLICLKCIETLPRRIGEKL